MTPTQVRALVANGQWVGNAYRAYHYYLSGSEADQQIAAAIYSAYGPAIDAATRTAAAASLGRLGGRAGRGESKRRAVDYAALGRKGGQAGKGKRKPRE